MNFLSYTVVMIPLMKNVEKENGYRKIPLLRPPFGLPKSGLFREVVLILNLISEGKYHLGLGKTGLNSEVVLILGS